MWVIDGTLSGFMNLLGMIPRVVARERAPTLGWMRERRWRSKAKGERGDGEKERRKRGVWVVDRALLWRKDEAGSQEARKEGAGERMILFGFLASCFLPKAGSSPD